MVVNTNLKIHLFALHLFLIGVIFAERIHVKYLRNDFKTGKGTIWYKQNRHDNYLYTQEKEQIKDFNRDLG